MDDLTSKKIVRNQRLKNVTDKAKKPGWQVLPPEGQGECDYDPEHEGAFEGMPQAELRRNAAIHQMREAKRLADDYALLRPGTRKDEISQARLNEITAVVTAMNKLLAKLRKRQRTEW